MTMKDFNELTEDRRTKAFKLLGYAQGMLEGLRNGNKIPANVWKTYDELRLSYESACRDLDDCLTTEAMVNSIED